MKYLNQYVISFAGLKLGLHQFKFEVDDQFFACFEHSEITNGNFKIQAELEKQSAMMILELTIDGSVKVLCDRCGDDLDLPIQATEKYVVKFAELDEDNADEIIVLDPKEHQLFLGDKIFELIILNLPQKRTHLEGECNEEALKKLEKYKPTDGKDDTDPRWDMLKNIKFN